MNYLVFFSLNTNVTQNGKSLSTNFANTLNTTSTGGVFLGPYQINPSKITEGGNISILCCVVQFIKQNKNLAL